MVKLFLDDLEKHQKFEKIKIKPLSFIYLLKFSPLNTET
jgi:hypothetical protein